MNRLTAKVLFGLSIFLLIAGFTFNRKRVFTPPGMVCISDTLFMDETEVTNLSWHEYLYWLKSMYGKTSQEYLSALPDTTVWLFDGMNANHAMMQSSFSNVKHFKDYPVSGVSYEQASAFCKWRTERVRYFVNYSKRYKACDFSFRLPTRTEWEFAANGSPEVYSHLNPPTVIHASSNSTVMNVSWPANLSYEQGGSINHPLQVKRYASNLFRIYDMTGNVAEMLLEKGQSKGGSLYHTPEQARNGKIISYQKPAAWLGFRCVCVVNRN